MPETDLYLPIKRFLERQGYEVKAEIGRCDVVAVRAGEPPVVVELKTAFSLDLLLQAVDRLAVAETVYVACPAARAGRSGLWDRRRTSILRLCRRLGLGLLTVSGDRVEVHLDPLPYRPRTDTRRQGLLLKEFARRVGDHNLGGSTRRPLVTAYRQDALRCAQYLGGLGAAKVADIRSSTGVGRAAAILQRDVYCWFARETRGVYRLSPKGQAALVEFGSALLSLRAAE